MTFQNNPMMLHKSAYMYIANPFATHCFPSLRQEKIDRTCIYNASDSFFDYKNTNANDVNSHYIASILNC